MATIKIKFKDTPTFTSDFDIDINFTCDNISYTSIVFKTSGTILLKNILRYVNSSSAVNAYSVTQSQWGDAKYQYIEIDTSQTNYATFINAMKSNIDGVLLENGTYVWVDIPTKSSSDVYTTIDCKYNRLNSDGSYQTEFAYNCTSMYAYNRTVNAHSKTIIVEFGNGIEKVNYGTSGGWQFDNDDKNITPTSDNTLLRSIKLETDQYIDYDFYNYAIGGNQLVKQEATKVSIDLTTLSGWGNVSSGEHSIQVVAKADNYRDSEKSTAVTFTKASTTATIPAGTYKFVDTPDMSSMPSTNQGITYAFNFTSNNKSFTSITLSSDTTDDFAGVAYSPIGTGFNFIGYGNERSKWGYYDDDDNFWHNETSYQLITTTSDQEVSTDFYNWFTANTTIRTTSPNLTWGDNVSSYIECTGNNISSSPTALEVYALADTSTSLQGFFDGLGITYTSDYDGYLVRSVGDISTQAGKFTVKLDDTSYVAKLLYYANGIWLNDVQGTYTDSSDVRTYSFTIPISGTVPIILLVSSSGGSHTLTSSSIAPNNIEVNGTALTSLPYTLKDNDTIVVKYPLEDSAISVNGVVQTSNNQVYNLSNVDVVVEGVDGSINTPQITINYTN